MALVVEGDRVDCVDFVLAVVVGVEAVHHHHQLAGGFEDAVAGVDDEAPVEAFVEVPLEGCRVAVVELDARW